MDQGELQALLRTGIEAVKTGDRTRGRALLSQVVAADERVEPAWLWLSTALDDPADQLVALDNVLALNPSHVQAQAAARVLRSKLGMTEVQPEPVALTVPEVPVPVASAQAVVAAGETDASPPPYVPAYFVADPADDPYQCAYCGRPTEPEHVRCPHCRRALLTGRRSLRGGYLYAPLLLAGVHTQLALLEAVGIYGASAFPAFTSVLPGADIWAVNVVGPAVVRAVLWALVVLVLLSESFGTFRTTLVMAAADLAWIGAGYALGRVSPELSILNGAFSGLIFSVALVAMVGALQSRIRLRVVLDKGLTSALEFERQARAYVAERKWALAALHWRRAIALNPHDPAYYKALGHAQARLGRTEAARQAWSSGAELDPKDAEFGQLLAGHK